MVPFSDRLRQARTAKGLLQKEVAEHLNMTSRAYQYYEAGRRRPDYEALVAIADYLEVTTDYLLGRSNAPK